MNSKLIVLTLVSTALLHTQTTPSQNAVAQIYCDKFSQLVDAYQEHTEIPGYKIDTLLDALQNQCSTDQTYNDCLDSLHSLIKDKAEYHAANIKSSVDYTQLISGAKAALVTAAAFYAAYCVYNNYCTNAHQQFTHLKDDLWKHDLVFKQNNANLHTAHNITSRYPNPPKELFNVAFQARDQIKELRWQNTKGSWGSFIIMCMSAIPAMYSYYKFEKGLNPNHANQLAHYATIQARIERALS